MLEDLEAAKIIIQKILKKEDVSIKEMAEAMGHLMIMATMINGQICRNLN